MNATGARGRPTRNVVALLGGLGNQLFQVAFGRWLERRTGWETWYDVSRLWGPTNVLHLGGLGRQLRGRLVARALPRPVPSGWTRELAAPDGSIGWPTRIVTDLKLTESPDAPAKPFVPECDAPAWWYGYWQLEEYAAALVPALAEALHEVRRRRSPAPFLGVTVRRGNDMLRTPFAVPSAWFGRAVARLRKSGAADLPIRVYSDELAWCERHLDLGEPSRVAEPPAGPIEQLAQLSDAAALVLSRSSFSWWAAALASRRSAPIVYPAPWPLAARAQPGPPGAPPWTALPIAEETEALPKAPG